MREKHGPGPSKGPVQLAGFQKNIPLQLICLQFFHLFYEIPVAVQRNLHPVLFGLLLKPRLSLGFPSARSRIPRFIRGKSEASKRRQRGKSEAKSTFVPGFGERRHKNSRSPSQISPAGQGLTVDLCCLAMRKEFAQDFRGCEPGSPLPRQRQPGKQSSLTMVIVNRQS
jgi:hypothetical protein